MKVFYIRNIEGQYYTGELRNGHPFFSADEKDAIQLDSEDIQMDFPHGLPHGCATELMCEITPRKDRKP